MSGEAGFVPGASYRVGYECVAGALHERRGSPGQDAGHCLQPCPGELPVLLALSDGHGSAQYFRSDRGAQTAVEVAVEIGEELAMSAVADLSTIRREAQERLPQRIVQRWRERILRHLEEQPFTDEERAQLLAAKGARAVETLERDPHSAYGATLLVVIVTSQFLLFAQLGDGDILRVDRDGGTRTVFPAAADAVGEDTASLCMDGAWREFQVQVFPLQNGPPPLILVSTDGYSKSFKSDADFLRIGSDYLEMFRSQGVEAVQARLRGYLMQATREGCGDDVTLGFIRCSEPEDFDSRRRRQIDLEQRLEAKADHSELQSMAVWLERLQEEFERRHEDLRQRLDAMEWSARRARLIYQIGFASLLIAVVFWLSRS